jgi:hypothetical protein
VEDGKYISDKISVLKRSFNRQQAVQEVLDEYFMGRRVDAYYNAEDAGDAVLETGITFQTLIPLIIGLALSVLSGISAVVILLKK